MRRNLLIALVIGIAGGGLMPAAAYAQATGSLTGIVTDQSGAVMPGVTIDVTNVATNQTRNAVTGTDGFYSVLLLQPGRYDVKATLSTMVQQRPAALDVADGDNRACGVILRLDPENRRASGIEVVNISVPD